MYHAVGRSFDYKRFCAVAALASIVAAVLAGAPAAACPDTQVAEGAPAPSQAGPVAAELKFDWPLRGRIVYECWTVDKEKITVAARNGVEVGPGNRG